MNFISLFSGAGGLDLGFEKAGFTPVVAYDIDQAAVDTYNFNRNKDLAKKTDLANLTAKEIIAEIKNANPKGPIVGVVGGPPCQYFSMGNRSAKKRNDLRRILPRTYAVLLKELNAALSLDFFIFENVFGLAKPAHEKDFKKILSMLTAANFHTFPAIIDAYNFGVPQKRKRLFIVGFNKDKYPEGIYEFPKGRNTKRSIEDAIGGLQEPIYFRKKLNSDDFPEHPNHWTMQPRSKKFKRKPPRNLRNGTRSFRRLKWNEPSYTVAYGNNEIHIHPDGHRRLSIYEAMLLQGFPRKAYVLRGHLSEQVSLVSDAVPPPVAYHLARSIAKIIQENG